MKYPPGYRGLLAAGVAVWCGVAQAQSPVTATPLVATDGSHPFDAAGFARVPQNLAAAGYLEREFLLSGSALVYQYADPASTSDSVVPVQSTPVPYVNRILVRMPADPWRFSGNVIVEIANDSLNTDIATAWSLASPRFIENGDAYVLLTASPVAEASLKAYAPARYAALSWPTVAATVAACGAGPEGGIIYDEISGLGGLLRSGAADSPLAGYRVSALYLYGYSAGATDLLTYDRVFGLNSPLYDAYFLAAGGIRSPLNSCEPAFAGAIRTAPPASSVSAVFQVQTISEREIAAQAGFTVSSGQDSNAPARYRYYDIAGAPHVSGDLFRGAPEIADYPDPAIDLASLTQAQASALCDQPTGSLLSAFPNRYVYDAMWADLEDWVRWGLPPPIAARQDLDGTTLAGFDPPSSGGWRSPAVDVQLQYYVGFTDIPPSQGAAVVRFCSLLGYQLPIGPTQSALYDAAVVADTATLLAGRFLTFSDASALFADPALATEYPDGTTTIPGE